MLDLDLLDHNGIAVRIEVGQDREFAHPGPVHLIGSQFLPGFVEHVDGQIAVGQRFRVARLSNLVGPGVEGGVMRDAVLQRDDIVLGPTAKFVAAARIAPLSVLDHFGGPLQRTHLAGTGDIIRTGVELHPELEILVGVELLGIDRQLAMNRHSPDDSEISVDSSDFAASLEARREMWLATSSFGQPERWSRG
jgi:hypothetical protein